MIPMAAPMLLYGLTVLGLVLLIPSLTASVVLGALAIPNMLWVPALLAMGWGADGTLPIGICFALLIGAAIARRVTAPSPGPTPDADGAADPDRGCEAFGSRVSRVFGTAYRK